MNDSGEYYVGVDLGGTKILALVVTAAGQVLARAKGKTRPGAAPIADQIGAAIDDALQQASLSADDITAVGVAIPGVVDSATGQIIKVPNLEIDDPLLVESLRRRYELPITMGNDVNLGTLAECWLGAGRGAQDAVGIFVGTGIGGGVVIGGRLRTGPEDLAGEIGHMVLQVDGPRCNCGNLGCFEALASRNAIERDIRAALQAGRQSSIVQHVEEGERIRSGDLKAALDEGDELVTEVLTRAAHYLGQGVLTVRHLLDPELIIFGGGVIEACGDFLMPLIEQELRADGMRGSRNVLRLVVSELGDNAVALGAAACARAEISGLSLADFEASRLEEAVARAGSDYPTVEALEFGAVVVAGERVEYDIHIRADGRVRKRKKKRLRKKYGTSHVVDAREVDRACKGNPDVLIIGSGFQGMLRLSDDAIEYLDTLGLRYELLPSPEAVQRYNTLKGSKALILHLTC